MAETEEAKRLSLSDIAKRLRHGDTVYYIIRKRTGTAKKRTFVSVFAVYDGSISDITAHVGRVLDLPYDNVDHRQVRIGNIGYNVGQYLQDKLIEALRLPPNGLNIEEL